MGAPYKAILCSQGLGFPDTDTSWGRGEGTGRHTHCGPDRKWHFNSRGQGGTDQAGATAEAARGPGWPGPVQKPPFPAGPGALPQHSSSLVRPHTCRGPACQPPRGHTSDRGEQGLHPHLLRSPWEVAGLSRALGMGGVGWALAGGIGLEREPEALAGEAMPRMGPSPRLLQRTSFLARGLPPPPQPCRLPVPGQPALSSIDASSPIYYNKLHLPLPRNPALPHPRPKAPTSPSSGGDGCPSSSGAASRQQPGVPVRPAGLGMERAGWRGYSR